MNHAISALVIIGASALLVSCADSDSLEPATADVPSSSAALSTAESAAGPSAENLGVTYRSMRDAVAAGDYGAIWDASSARCRDKFTRQAVIDGFQGYDQVSISTDAPEPTFFVNGTVGTITGVDPVSGLTRSETWTFTDGRWVGDWC